VTRVGVVDTLMRVLVLSSNSNATPVMPLVMYELELYEVTLLALMYSRGVTAAPEQPLTPMVNGVDGEVFPAAAARVFDEYVGKITVAVAAVKPLTVSEHVEAFTVPLKSPLQTAPWR